MSIYNLPPLTQTPERNQSGFSRRAIERRLANASVKGVLPQAEIIPAPVTYLPTHDNLRYQINEIHTVIMPAIAEEFQEIARKVDFVNGELMRLAERQQILQETGEDLGLFRQSILPRNDTDGDGYLMSALREALVELDAEYEVVQAKRVEAVIELEQLEQMDFTLLQKGQ